MRRLYYILIIFCLFNIELHSEENIKFEKHIFHPKAFNTFEMRFLLGFSIARLPAVVVEEEISFSPMVFAYYRLGLPLNFSMNIQCNSNYISKSCLALLLEVINFSGRS